MRKVLFCDNTLWGLLNFRSGVIRYLVSRDYDVILVAPEDRMCSLSALPEKVRYIPVEMDRTGMNPVADLRYYRVLKKVYKTERPDYVFHYTIKPNIYGTLAARSLGIPSSAIIAGLGHVYTQKGIGTSMARLMYKYAMRFPERVMVLNRSNYDTLIARRAVRSEKLLWLEGGEGVDLSQFEPRRMPENDKPVFLMVCRLLYEKGYAEFVSAAEVLKERAEFRIMGPIDEHPSAVRRETIEADVARGVIRYIDYSPDVISQVTAADCIVLPSFYGEGLSRVLMEGLALARPVITTDIPGCRETVVDGVNGFLCRPKDSGSLIDAVRKMLALDSGQRREMGRQSRLLAEKIFDMKRVIARYEALLDKRNERY